jgi:D-sedoheptulose 7-phosphate isomerase
MAEGRAVRCKADTCCAPAGTEIGVNTLSSTLDEHLTVVSGLRNLEPLLAEVARQMIAALRNGGKVLWMGNGGSAADSQHLAAELVGRFSRERRSLASLALTTDTSVITAVSNDYSFDEIFRRQIEAICNPQDVVIGISTSGNSKNIRAGLLAAKQKGSFTVALAGQTQALTGLADVCINVPSRVTARIQEAHILIGHILCDWVESDFV